ncbi:MAG: MBL fold metallo-hydrolase [Acidobacteriota bacterium]|nr:MBL fold metallo-hydrolase [Acidobacteriota bacterium]
MLETVAGGARMAPAFLRRFSEEAARPISPAPNKPTPDRWPDRGLHAAWLGHSTVLLKVDGTTILTDPVLGPRAGLNIGPVPLGLTLGIKRLVEPALRAGELPRPDLILLSHAHMDHFDIPTLRRLESKSTAVITAAKTSGLLRPQRFKSVQELSWGEHAQIGPLKIQAFEVNHWGARMRTDTFRGYNGYTIEAGRYRILFAGDTAITGAFRGLRSKRPFDLAIMPIGAYDPWIHFHCTPEQAWKMGNDAGAELFLPVHHQTFQLSREPYLEPIERFYEASGSAPDRIALGEIGQEFHLSLSGFPISIPAIHAHSFDM